MQNYIIKQTIVGFCAYIGQLLVGGALAWSAPLIPKLLDADQTPLSEVATDEESFWVASTIYIGFSVGPSLAGYLSNKYGRKPSLLIGGIISAISFLLLATSVHIAMMYIGRILTGVGTGIVHVVNLVYLGEIASKDIRGIILTGSAIFSTLGILVVYAYGPFVSYAEASYILLAISGVYIVGLYVIPESPIFYAIKGNEEKARESLAVLGRYDTNDVTKVLSAKQMEVQSAVAGWKELFGTRSNRRGLCITVVLNMLLQLSGVMAVVLFATTIFDMAGSTIDADIATIIIGVTQFLASCITPWFIEKTGRKVLLLLSTALCFLSLTVLGIYFFLYEYGIDVTVVGWLPLVTLIIFFLSFDFGFGIIPYTYVGEMFTGNARDTGSNVTFTIAWIFGFITTLSFGYVMAAIGGHFTFWIFAVACAVAFIFTLVFVPETKGKSLSEIQELLSR